MKNSFKPVLTLSTLFLLISFLAIPGYANAMGELEFSIRHEYKDICEDVTSVKVVCRVGTGGTFAFKLLGIGEAVQSINKRGITLYKLYNLVKIKAKPGKDLSKSTHYYCHTEGLYKNTWKLFSDIAKADPKCVKQSNLKNNKKGKITW